MYSKTGFNPEHDRLIGTQTLWLRVVEVVSHAGVEVYADIFPCHDLKTQTCINGELKAFDVFTIDCVASSHQVVVVNAFLSRTSCMDVEIYQP